MINASSKSSRRGFIGAIIALQAAVLAPFGSLVGRRARLVEPRLPSCLFFIPENYNDSIRIELSRWILLPNGDPDRFLDPHPNNFFCMGIIYGEPRDDIPLRTIVENNKTMRERILGNHLAGLFRLDSGEYKDVSHVTIVIGDLSLNATHNGIDLFVSFCGRGASKPDTNGVTLPALTERQTAMWAENYREAWGRWPSQFVCERFILTQRTLDGINESLAAVDQRKRPEPRKDWAMGIWS